jgi:hypothetical protein
MDLIRVSYLVRQHYYEFNVYKRFVANKLSLSIDNTCYTLYFLLK